MAGRMVGGMFVVALLFGVILSSGVEARRLSQTVLSIETEDGLQRGNIQVDSEDGVAQVFSSSSSSGSGPSIASSSASVSSSPSGVSGEVGAIGGDADGFFQGVGGSISAPRPSRTPPPSPARPPRSSTSVSGTGNASTSVTGTGSASVGGEGSTSVMISGQTRTESTQEEEAENMDDAPAPVDDAEEEVEKIPEPAQPIEISEPTPEPEPMPLEEVPAPQPVRVPSPPAPQPVKAESVVITTSEEEEEEEEEVVPTRVSASTEVSITTESGKQEVIVDGKSGPKVCLTSDTSMLEELLDEGYDVTILTPTRLGYEVTMMVRSGYATSETSFLFDHVPEDVQELCNYDPETAPRPARRVASNPNPEEADAVLRDLCESRMVLYLPQLLDACWSAGYLTLVDLAVLG